MDETLRRPIPDIGSRDLFVRNSGERIVVEEEEEEEEEEQRSRSRNGKD